MQKFTYNYFLNFRVLYFDITPYMIVDCTICSQAAARWPRRLPASYILKTMKPSNTISFSKQKKARDTECPSPSIKLQYNLYIIISHKTF